MATFNYQIICVEKWRNNNEVLSSEHKTLENAEKQKSVYENWNKKQLKKHKLKEMNTYYIKKI